MIQRIQYTTDQERKLLEMTNVLFPEYKETSINSDWLYLNRGEIPLDAIPIFEFCLTHLVVRLSKEFTKQGLSEADYTHNQYPNWFSEKLSYHLNPFRNEETGEDILFIHPLDYLYTEFLKLKK